MGKIKSLMLNTIMIAIGKFSTQVLNFLLLPLYTHILAPEVYGEFDFIIAIGMLIAPLVTLLLEESMFRFLVDCNEEKEKKTVITNTIIFALGNLFLFILIMLLLLNLTGYKLGKYIILYVVSIVLISITNAITRGNADFVTYTISNFISSAITIIMNVILIVYFKCGLEGLIYSIVIANTISVAFVFFKLRIYRYIDLKIFDKNLFKEMVKYSMPLVPNTMCWSVINTSDRLFIMNVLGAASNGIYSVACKFSNVANTCYSFFDIAWKETSVHIAKEEEKDENYSFIYNNIKNVLITIVVVLIPFIKLVYPVIIAEEYLEGTTYVPILLISVIFSSIAGFLGGIFTAYKETKIIGFTSIMAAGINLIINILLIKKIGIYAAAFSTLIASFMMYAVRKLCVKRFVKLENRNMVIQKILLVISVVLFYLNQSVWVEIVYLIIVFIIFFYINKEVINLVIEKFLDRIPSKKK